MVHRSLVLTQQIRSGVISFDFDVLHFVAEYPLQGHDGGFVTFNSDVQLREVPRAFNLGFDWPEIRDWEW